MNILIIGNVGSGKSTIAKALIAHHFTEPHRLYSIDDLRWRFSDGTYAGEFYAWSLMFRAAQNEMSGVFEFSGTGTYAQSFKQIIKESIDAGRQWKVIRCECHMEILAERVANKPADLPIPLKIWNSNADRLDTLERLKDRLQLQGESFWGCDEIAIRTDSGSLDESLAIALEWLRRDSEEANSQDLPICAEKNLPLSKSKQMELPNI